MQLSAPDSDEIEVTIFGRGVGECCVLHLGKDNWVIVDSFNHTEKSVDPITRAKTLVPVARWYLDQISVEPEHVKTIFVTHFHKDHYVGLPALRDYYSEARLVVTRALKADLFTKLFSSAVDFDNLKVFGREIVRARTDTAKDPAGMLDYWSTGMTYTYGTYGESLVRLTGLSPTRAAIDTSLTEVGRAFEAADPADLRSLLKDENLCSITIHVEVPGGAHALLCSDLPAEPSEYGWHAVLAEPSHTHLPESRVVKVPHHGSAGADHPPMWAQLVGAKPHMMVTPYTPQSLPRQTDLERLCGRGELWQASPTNWQTNDQFGFGEMKLPATGFVRARRKYDEDDWRIESRAPAFHVNPKLAGITAP